MASPQDVPRAELIGCPNCDLLHHAKHVADGERAICSRCHTVLIAPRAAAYNRALALSVANLILVVAAVFHPFLEIHAAGIVNRVSLLDVATSFGSGALVVVSVTSVAMILLVPLLRAVFLAYALAPLALQHRAYPGARWAFRVTQQMKPWAMTEIFAIGCAVALVKVADLARLNFGPAFWMFIVLSAFVLLVDRSLCSWSIWAALDEAEQEPGRGTAPAPTVRP
ncbi:paraquat-inducible protein A [Vannielia litorea]|uniref:paraquat-inducible protein A n=1 Tax=Vannielia litorea TaxID=1217970 RepID=UPI001BCD0D57|nr:paraquat-inducible protein A [Vannielia litorea]MBS8225145.1 paraquat-inducible protein A [Vannielia litorea]